MLAKKAATAQSYVAVGCSANANHDGGMVRGQSGCDYQWSTVVVGVFVDETQGPPDGHGDRPRRFSAQAASSV